MSFFGFNRRHKHQQFKYLPRFYDPVKEELEERLKPYKGSNVDHEVDLTKDRIRLGFKTKSRSDVGYRKKQVTSSNVRLISIILVLGFLAYLILSSNKFLALLESLSS